MYIKTKLVIFYVCGKRNLLKTGDMEICSGEGSVTPGSVRARIYVTTT